MLAMGRQAYLSQERRQDEQEFFTLCNHILGPGKSVPSLVAQSVENVILALCFAMVYGVMGKQDNH